MFQYSELVKYQTCKEIVKGMLEQNVPENILRQCIPIRDEEYRYIREELEWERREDTWYQLVLPDYSMPSFISGAKNYYGTLHDIRMMMAALRKDKQLGENYAELLRAFDEFLNGNETVCNPLLYGEIPLLRPIELLGTKEHQLDNYRWTYTNVWDYPSEMRCSSVRSQHIWLQREGLCLRCVKASFENLESRHPSDPIWRPIGCCGWGFPHAIEWDESRHYSRLAVCEKTFDGLKQLQADRAAFQANPDVNFTGICEDVFGAG